MEVVVRRCSGALAADSPLVREPRIRLASAMIVITCAACDRRMLLPMSMVTGLDRRVDLAGQVLYELAYTSWCGAPGTKLVKGPK